MATTHDVRLEMTLADVAALCRVQRSVTSMWRTRSAASDIPFPDPVRTVGNQPFFDAADVVAWLEATGRGRNGEARLDAPLYGRLPGGEGSQEDAFEAHSALLCLQAVTGAALAELDVDELLDLADEADPDDVMLYREIAVLGDSLRVRAAWVDTLVEAAYSPARAFEHLLHRRTASLPPAAGTLTQRARDVVAEVARGLATSGGPGDGAARYVDPTISSGDLLLAACGEEPLSSPVPLLRGGDHGPLRLARRRLRVHGVLVGPLRVDAEERFDLSGSLTLLARLPDESQRSASTHDMLTSLENIALAMDDRHSAVVIGPAGALLDRLTGEEETIRDDMLRTGKVRAVIRLPRGLVRERPRQSLALWVLGPAHRRVPADERWMVIADLSDLHLTDAVIADLVTDLVAANGDRTSVRAHAFSFGVVRPTRHILAHTGRLVDAGGSLAQPTGGRAADIVVQIDRLRNHVEVAAPLFDYGVAVNPGMTATASVTTLGALASQDRLRLVPGNRVDPTDLGDEGLPVIGPEDLTDGVGPTGRRLDRLLFAQQYDNGRVTEPGDVIFCTSPRPRALLDKTGGSIVASPARALRVHEGPKVLSQLVAEAINRMDPRAREWRLCQVPLVAGEQARQLGDALSAVERARADLRRRLAALDRLGQLVTDGITGGLVTVSASTTQDQTRQEGT